MSILRTSCSILAMKSTAVCLSSIAPPLSVSTMDLIEARGLRSSWETLLTNSLRVVSSWRNAVRSWRESSTPSPLPPKGIAMALTSRL